MFDEITKFTSKEKFKTNPLYFRVIKTNMSIATEKIFVWNYIKVDGTKFKLHLPVHGTEMGIAKKFSFLHMR